MPLDGSDYEELRDLIVDAFDLQALVELVRFRLGRDIFNDVSDRLPKPTVVYDYLGVLQREGLLTKFLRAVLIARPSRPDLWSGIQRIWPEVGDVALTAKEEAGQVDKAVKIIAERLSEEAVLKLVRQSAASLRALSQEISLLRGYKTLHDSLHVLQMQILRRLAVSARRLLTDPASVQDLAECRTGIQTALVQINATITTLPALPPSLRKWETDWLERLRLVDRLAEAAITDSLQTPGLQSAQLLRRILRHEPARIDRYLRITAEAIDLEGLNRLFSQAADLSNGNPDEQPFREGQQASKLLISRLQALVNQHSRWQEIDGQLWDAEDYFPRAATADPSDFAAFWESLSRQVLSLTLTEPDNPLAKTLSNACTNIEALRQAPAPDWTKVTTAYVGFRQNAIVYFFGVDTDLKSLADEVAGIGDSLQNLLVGV